MPRDDEAVKPEDLLQSLYRVHQRIELAAGNAEQPALADCGDGEIYAWNAAFNELRRQVDDANGQISVTAAAQAVYEAFELSLAGTEHKEPVPFSDLAPSVQLKWQALVRHYVNLLEMDLEEDNIQTHEENMALWWGAKAKQLTEAN